MANGLFEPIQPKRSSNDVNFQENSSKLFLRCDIHTMFGNNFECGFSKILHLFRIGANFENDRYDSIVTNSSDSVGDILGIV